MTLRWIEFVALSAIFRGTQLADLPLDIVPIRRVTAAFTVLESIIGQTLLAAAGVVALKTEPPAMATLQGRS